MLQRVVEVILASVKLKLDLVYLDDVIILSKLLEGHLCQVATVLPLLIDERSR